MYATEQQAAILRAAVEEIKRHPETFDMRFWTNDCGTVCCLAGHVVKNSIAGEWPQIVTRQMVAEDEGPQANPPVRATAIDIIGLTEMSAEVLFDSWKWPDQFTADEFDDSPTPEQLEARVEHWIETGE